MTEPGYIKTACPACGQHIEAPDNYSGKTVSCPNCSKPVTIPHPKPLVSPQRTQRLQIPMQPPPHHTPPPPPRPSPVPPFPPASSVPQTNVLDAYLLPVLLALIGFTCGEVCGAMDIPIWGSWPFLVILLLGIAEGVILLGHLGAIAARLKTIEALLRVSSSK